MKIMQGKKFETWSERDARRDKEVEHWRQWFAWRPVKLSDTHEWVWLENLWKKGESSYFGSDLECWRFVDWTYVRKPTPDPISEKHYV